MIISEDGWVFEGVPSRRMQCWVMFHGGEEPVLLMYEIEEHKRGWDLTYHYAKVRCWRPLVPPKPPA